MLADELVAMRRHLDTIIAPMATNKVWGFDRSWSEFATGLSFLTPQSYGTRLQNRLIKDLGGTSTKSRDNCGDARIPSLSSREVEIKCSLLTSVNSSLNLVQIRPWQSVDYLCTAFDIRDTFTPYVFFLTKEDMAAETKALQANSAHGTRHANAQNANIELRFQISFEDTTDPHLARWIHSYRRSDIEAALLGGAVQQLAQEQA